MTGPAESCTPSRTRIRTDVPWPESRCIRPAAHPGAKGWQPPPRTAEGKPALLPRSPTAADDGGVFFLHGGDEYRKAAAAKELLERYADPATEAFNVDRIVGTETTVERLASVIATPPMMAPWRVVLVKEAEGLAGSPKAREVLLGAARSPPPGLVLILQATVPARSKARFYKDLARAATAVEFKPVPVDAVPGWLVSWAREELGVTVEVEAAQALAGAAGPELGVLTQEVRKLAEMVGEAGVVDLEAVRKGGINLPRQDRWAWFDLVGNRRIREAARALPVLVEQGETMVGLVIGLSTQLLRIGVAIEGGMPAVQAALPPYQRFLARRLVGQARRWTRAELANAVRGLRRLDQLLKASAIPGEVLMEEWLLGLAVRGRGGHP